MVGDRDIGLDRCMCIRGYPSDFSLASGVRGEAFSGEERKEKEKESRK